MTDSSRTGLRELRAQHLRAALIESAQHLFAERGFDHVSVDDIAERAQASRRTFFRYFGVKEDVLFAQDDALLAALLEGMGHAAGTDPVVQARAGVQAVVAVLEPQREELRQRQLILDSVPALQDRTIAKYARWERAALARVDDRVDTREEEYHQHLRLAVPAALLCLRLGYEQWVSATDGPGLQDHVDAVADRFAPR